MNAGLIYKLDFYKLVATELFTTHYKAVTDKQRQYAKMNCKMRLSNLPNVYSPTVTHRNYFIHFQN